MRTAGERDMMNDSLGGRAGTGMLRSSQTRNREEERRDTADAANLHFSLYSQESMLHEKTKDI